MRDPALTTPKTSLSWLWALFPLLLAAGLVIPALGDIALNGDEIDSLVTAGVFRPGPHSFTDVWNYTTRVIPGSGVGLAAAVLRLGTPGRLE